ncbi:MAG: hypothetical protein FJX80_03460 [Bacteroidetes bacterium]|nr:hypothetical protein [Bacteroidota bacterium]
MINTMRLFLLLFFFFLTVGFYAQSEKEMVRRIAFLYQDGKIEEACQLSKDGIAKYPSNASFEKLSNLCCNAASPIPPVPEAKCEHGNILQDCAKCKTVENPMCQHENDPKTCAYCNPPPPPRETIEGCTDRKASNYNSRATQDDGSCRYNVSADLSHPYQSSTIYWNKELAGKCSSIVIIIQGEKNNELYQSIPISDVSKGSYNFVPKKNKASWNMEFVRVTLQVDGLDLQKYSLRGIQSLPNQQFPCHLVIKKK